MKSKMCDWFEVRLEKDISKYFFSDQGAQGEAREAYFCTSTELSPPRDAELGKKTKERFWSSVEVRTVDA